MPTIQIDTNQNSFFDVSSKWYRPHTDAPKPRKSFLKISEKYSFDLELALRDLERIQEIAPFRSYEVGPTRKKRRTYQGIGLTHRPEACEPFYDALTLTNEEGQVIMADQYFDRRSKHSLNERDYSEKNILWNGYLGSVLSKFKYPLTKVRLVKMRPRGAIPAHIDFPHYEQIKLHSFLTTNHNVYIDLNGQTHQIPADGRFYWFDTGRPHAVWNDGDSDRIDLCVNLRLYYDAEGHLLNSIETDVVDLLESGEL